MKVAEIDDAPECPEALAYLWKHFAEIDLGLSSNGFGPPLVTWEALRAWTDFMAVQLEPWEARALVVLGHKRAVIADEEQRKKVQAGGRQNPHR